MNRQRIKLVDVPAVPADATEIERQALALATEAAKQCREIGGTLVVRIVGRLGASRAVQWTFHSVPCDNPSRLAAALVATWRTDERLLTVPALAASYCRTPAEALAAGLAAIKRRHETQITLNRGRAAKPPKQMGSPRTAGRKPSGKSNKYLME